MKRFLLAITVLALTLAVQGASFAASDSIHVDTLLNTSKAINTDWFSTDFQPDGTDKSRNEPVKFGFLVNVTTDSIVNVGCKMDGTTAVQFDFNKGVALTAGAWYYFTMPVPAVATECNIQHQTGTQNVTGLVWKSRNLDM